MRAKREGKAVVRVALEPKLFDKTRPRGPTIRIEWVHFRVVPVEFQVFKLGRFHPKLGRPLDLAQESSNFCGPGDFFCGSVEKRLHRDGSGDPTFFAKLTLDPIFQKVRILDGSELDAGAAGGVDPS